MDIKDSIDFLLERTVKYGADASESMGFSSFSIGAECRLGKTQSMEHSLTKGVDVRVFCGQRQAVASSSILEKNALDDMAQTVVDMARLLPEDEFCGLGEVFTSFDGSDLDIFDDKTPTTGDLLVKALETEETALSVQGITNSNGAGASFSQTETIIANSKGFFRQMHRTQHAVGVAVLTENDDGTKERDGDSATAVFASDLRSCRQIGLKAAERTLKKRGSIKIDSMKTPVIMDPRVSRGFTGHFLSAIDASSVAKKTTFLHKMLGKKVFNNQIGLIENPFLKRKFSSRYCDAEGTPCRLLNLVEDGVLTTWMADLRSARQLNIEPTGHAVRSFGGLPSPAPSNVTWKKGKISPDELMADIRLGLYVTDVFGQGVNVVTGDYSRGVAGFLIENGQITRPVHEITIAGNLKEMFSSLSVANDVTDEYTVNAPTIRLENISIAGK